MSKRATAAKAGLKAAKAAPAKGKAAKGGLKLGRRKVERTKPATAFFYAQALVGNAEARAELADAGRSARKAYRRSSDRRGRPDLVALLDDRKAKREAGNAVASLRSALRIARKRRKKPRSVKGPATVLAVTAAGAGAGALIYKQRSSDETETAATPAAV